jgi:hypothetical protein
LRNPPYVYYVEDIALEAYFFFVVHPSLKQFSICNRLILPEPEQVHRNKTTTQWPYYTEQQSRGGKAKSLPN